MQETLEEDGARKPNRPQQVLNKESQNVADTVDAQMFITYVLLWQTLDEKGKKALLTEQELWLQQRRLEVEAAVVSKGGSLAAFERAGALTSFTKKRLSELETRLAQSSSPAETRR